MGRVFSESKSFEIETNKNGNQYGHSPFHLFLVIFELIVFCVTIFVNAVSSSTSISMIFIYLKPNTITIRIVY